MCAPAQGCAHFIPEYTGYANTTLILPPKRCGAANVKGLVVTVPYIPELTSTARKYGCVVGLHMFTRSEQGVAWMIDVGLGPAWAQAWAKPGCGASHFAQCSRDVCPNHTQLYGRVQRTSAKYGLEALYTVGWPRPSTIVRLST